MNMSNIQAAFSRLFKGNTAPDDTLPSGMTAGAVALDEAKRYGAMLRSETDPEKRAELSKKQASAFKEYAEALAVKDR